MVTEATSKLIAGAHINVEEFGVAVGLTVGKIMEGGRRIT